MKAIKLLLLSAFLLCGDSTLARAQETSAAAATPDAIADPARLTAAEIAALVDECGKRTSRMTGRMFSYTFNEADYDYERDKSGAVKSEHSKLYEVAPVRAGKRYSWTHVQVGEDGARFPEEKIERERERVVKQITDAEAEAARTPTQAAAPSPYVERYSSYGIRVEKRGGMSHTFWFVAPTDFLIWHEFYAPRRATLNNREAILLNFRPRPGYTFDRTNVRFSEGVEEFARVMARLGGRLWIDAQDRVIARLEAAPVEEVQAQTDAADAKAPLGFEFTRLANGTWAPHTNWYNSYGKESLFWKTSTSRVVKFSDFKLFTTSDEGEKLDAPPKPLKP